MKSDISKITTIAKGMKVSPTAVIDSIGTIVAISKELEATKRESRRLDAQKEYMLTDLRERYDFYYHIFNEIFAERRMAIQQSFEIIDKGLKENDKELIRMGLGSLTTVVSSSPFNNLSELAKILNSKDEIIEI